jgi:hypothetical protein
MKRHINLFLIFFIVIPITTAYAQNTAKSLDSLVIDLWPDYDRTSVLFLLTGSLPADTKLPANVTLPFPEKAQLNAIARIDSRDGNMKDDILSSPAPGEISFITPNLRFRLEYYLPYTLNNLQRSFDFNWLAGIPVDNFQLNIQQPRSANSLITKPSAENISTREDGFVYHTFPTRTVPAGQPVFVHVNYKMTSAQLSAERQTPQIPDKQTTETSAGSSINWVFVFGGLIVLAALVWQIASRRPSAKIRKSSDVRVEFQPQNKFCQKCDMQVDEDDKFCGYCGSSL